MTDILLLTDQRTPEKKMADRLVAAYWLSFPDMAEMWKSASVLDSLLIYNEPIPYLLPGDKIEMSPLPKWSDGGTVTGRFSGGRVPDWQSLHSRNEFVLPKDHPIVATDYRRLEARILAMATQINQHAQLTLESRVLIELFGHGDLRKLEPEFDRERRIAKLLKSSDRRQKKRGDRLFLSYRRNQPGINYNPYRKD